jgi:hypothetical protein
MAVGLRSALLVAATSVLFFACTTSNSGFVDGMTGVGSVGGDLHVDALPLDQSSDPPIPDGAVPDHPAPDAPAPDLAPEVRPDLAPDLGSDLAPDVRPPTDQVIGAACGAGSECKSGFCVDGFCCDKVCNNGCMACSKTRTTLANGSCGPAKDLEAKPCGKACGVVETRAAVVQKVCAAGTCVFPAMPVAVERCTNDNPCMNVFCDNAAARCVSIPACAADSCCCSSAGGTRACVKRDMCTGARMCAP